MKQQAFIEAVEAALRAALVYDKGIEARASTIEYDGSVGERWVRDEPDLDDHDWLTKLHRALEIFEKARKP